MPSRRKPGAPCCECAPEESSSSSSDSSSSASSSSSESVDEGKLVFECILPGIPSLRRFLTLNLTDANGPGDTGDLFTCLTQKLGTHVNGTYTLEVVDPDDEINPLWVSPELGPNGLSGVTAAHFEFRPCGVSLNNVVYAYTKDGEVLRDVLLRAAVGCPGSFVNAANAGISYTDDPYVVWLALICIDGTACAGARLDPVGFLSE